MAAKRVIPEEFKGEAIKPGTKECFLIRVGELTTGSEIALHVVVVCGRRDGPCVFIGAGQRADEAAGATHLNLCFIGRSLGFILEQMEVFARKVMPRVA